MSGERVTFLSVKKKYYLVAMYLFFLFWFHFNTYLFVRIIKSKVVVEGDVYIWFVKHSSLAIPMAYALSHIIIEIWGYIMYTWEILRENREKKKAEEKREAERIIERRIEKARQEGREEAIREMESKQKKDG